ncbi:protein CHROMATIN REMODELING 35 [Aristolochia californica]|uniref:protein CHROMATIN REMODELING 35 n=1 Tax=Aristolochia californica TaxID=171875 RepID=UPI0035E292FA
MGRKRKMYQTMTMVEFRSPDQSPTANILPRMSELYSPNEFTRETKRVKSCLGERGYLGASSAGIFHHSSKTNNGRSPSKVIDYSDPFALPNMLEALEGGKYGSETKEIIALCARRMELLGALYASYPSLRGRSATLPHQCSFANCCNYFKGQPNMGPCSITENGNSGSQDVIDLERNGFAKNAAFIVEDVKDGVDNPSIINLESDEEGDEELSQTQNFRPNLQRSMKEMLHNLGCATIEGNIALETKWKSSYLYEKVVLDKSSMEEKTTKEFKKQLSNFLENKDKIQGNEIICGGTQENEDVNEKLSSVVVLSGAVETANASYRTEKKDDGLGDLWREMTLALECSKEVASDNSADTKKEEECASDNSADTKKEEECEHSCILKDDLGYVCQICGVIQKSIATIFDFQWVSKSSKTYIPASRNKRDSDRSEVIQYSAHGESEYGLLEEVCIHPRHREQMKAHQLEGFKFLQHNLIVENPGGCILAHAPGSGKTFMVISFIQSFLAKYPHAKPLVVLPKGILPTWKREFNRWQVEDIPLYDFYTGKAECRSQQLEILNQWVEHRSVLFLGYKQFSNIVCGIASSKVEAACQEKLLKVPSLLILDEGHTPRNENTDVLHSLAKVETPRKVVLSGTLFQNHVKEVFNILKLVRPKFLKVERSKAIVRRVLSKVPVSGGSRRHLKAAKDSIFFDLVEETLRSDENSRIKIAVIKDLRELTSDVLHYYKGDFLDELPGLIDYTVVLNLSQRQKSVIQSLQKLEKFKRSSVGSAVYMHSQLKEISESASATAEKGTASINEAKIDHMIERMNIKDGIKTKFFLGILGLAESAGEKMIVFSRYILPLKFLERILAKTKGWSCGKEMFMITGESNQEHREWSMDKFNNSPDARVFFGSIKACGEGISLVGASRILILDVHLNPSVTRQAIGRAFRPGQTKKVYTYRLVAGDSPEEEDHFTSFRKELISKMWFEWSEFCGARGFDVEEVDVKSCEDEFLVTSAIWDDVKVLYKR